MRARIGWIIAMALASGATHAGEVEGVARVVTNELGALTRASPRGALEPVTFSFRGSAMRIDFQDARGARFTLLMPADATTGWLLGPQGGALPMPQVQLPLLYDADDPCKGRGMLADCQPMGDAFESGRNVKRWRYRFSNSDGPGRTRTGEMWIDAETGLVLRYSGRTGIGQPRQWRTTQIDYRPVADTLLELDPALLQAPAPGLD